MADKVERRAFLKNLAIGGMALSGAAALEGCGAKTTTTPTTTVTFDQEADVVIVGCGGTGVVAALEALAAGASVIILEKGKNPGGNTAISSGVIQAAGTTFQKQFTSYQADTPALHAGYWNEAGENVVDQSLVTAMANGMPDCITWLVKQGIPFINVYGVAKIPSVESKYMADRIHVPGGGANGASGWGAFYFKTLLANAKTAGATVLLETPATSLILDASGAVIGVEATSGTSTIKVKAKKGVVLASGGFDSNKDMAQTFSTHQLWAQTTGVVYASANNTGDGIRMGMDAGADLAGLGGTIGLPTTNVGIFPTLPGATVVPGIMVNANGLRFVAEDNHYGYVMRVAFNQESHLSWQVWDSNAMALGGAVVSGISGMSEDLSAEIADGKVFKSDTVAGLAAAIGVNADNLVRTIDTWNSDIKSTGKDSVWNKAVGLSAMDKGPYYAVKVVEYNLGTIGGLRINARSQVVDLAGTPITRLYAGGQVAGGFMGPYYPGTGSGIASTVYFGRLAGQNVAAETAWA